MRTGSLAASTPEHAAPLRRIQPSKGWAPMDLEEIWRFRELLYFLVWRDIKARYKQTFLGPAWALLRPLVMMVLFTIIFGGLAGIDSGSDTPYPLFVFAGLLAWTYFSGAITAGSSGIRNNAGILTKAYFPRVYAPLAAVTAPLVDLALSFTILAGLFAWYREAPGIEVLLLPAFAVMALLLAFGVGLWLASATIRYRDLPFALPFVTQLWLYVTPIIYPVTLVPERWQWLLELNPLTGVIQGFRWSLLGDDAPGPLALASSVGVTIFLLVAGSFYFRRAERTLADLV